MHVAQQPTKHIYTHANQLSCCTRVTQGRKDESMRVKEGGRKSDTRLCVCVLYLCLHINDYIQMCNVETTLQTYFTRKLVPHLSAIYLRRYMISKPNSSTMCQEQKAADIKSNLVIYVSHQIKKASICLITLQLPLNSFC